MDNIKNDKYYTDKILENINLLIKYTDGLSFKEFISNDMLIDAIMFRLVQIAENIKGLSDEFKKNHASIPWGVNCRF